MKCKFLILKGLVVFLGVFLTLSFSTSNACTGPQKRIQIGARDSVYTIDQMWDSIPSVNTWYASSTTRSEPTEDTGRAFFIDATPATIKINGTLVFLNAGDKGIDKYTFQSNDQKHPFGELGTGWHQPWRNIWYPSCLTQINDPIQGLSAPYDRPITDKFRYFIASNGNYNFIDYQWIPNVYKVRNNACPPAKQGDLLGFVHVETNISEHSGIYSYGLAYSTDSGSHWAYCGDIIRPACAASVNSDCNISGLPYLVVNDIGVNYFYIYFNEYADQAWMKYRDDADYSKKVQGVARAKVSDVLTAAATIFYQKTCSGCPFNFIPPPPANPASLPSFHKFIGDPSDKSKYVWDTATALTPGPAHAGSGLITMMRHTDLHADAAFCKPLNKYLMTVSNGTSANVKDTGELFLFSSLDGINWKDPILLDRTIDTTGDGIHKRVNYIEKPHSFFVDLNTSDDCDSVGNNFYIYSTYSYWQSPANVNSLYQQLWRRNIIISDATPIAQIAFGDNAVGTFVAGTSYINGGTTSYRSNTVDCTSVTDPGPTGLYQTERYGEYTCTVSGTLQSGIRMVPGNKYLVRLHFVEPYYSNSGKRQFNVFINNHQVLQNYDIFANTKVQFKALVKEFVTTATTASDGSGLIEVRFVSGAVDNPSCFGMEILTPPDSLPNQNDTAITSISIDPPIISIPAGSSQQFKATAYDYRGNPIIGQIRYNWSVTGGGAITQDGLFTAGNSAGGPYVISASGATAVVTINNSSVVNPALYRINCGSGGSVGEFSLDNYFNGGDTNYWTNTVNLSGLTNPAPQNVYHSERWGNYSYTFPGLIPNKNYDLRLHFMEPKFNGANQRRFNVTVNGNTILNNFDIFAHTNSLFKAYIKDTTISANSNGKIILGFQQGSNDFPTCNGIEIRPDTSFGLKSIAVTPISATIKKGDTITMVATAYNKNGSPISLGIPAQYAWRIDDNFGTNPPADFNWANDVSATHTSPTILSGWTAGAEGKHTWTGSIDSSNGTQLIVANSSTITVASYQITCGNNTVGTFVPTTNAMCSGGTLDAVTNNVDVSNVTNAPPQGVYGTERWGEYTYSLSGNTTPPIPGVGANSLIPGKGYIVRLHFIEPYFTTPGQRQFNVGINGNTVLQNFDILSQVGSQFKAISKDFLAAADSVGTITIRFTRGNADFPTCEGIEVIPDRDPFIIFPSPTVVTNSTTSLSAGVADGAGYIVPDAKKVIRWAIGPSDLTGSAINTLTGQFLAGATPGTCPIIISLISIYGITSTISIDALVYLR